MTRTSLTTSGYQPYRYRHMQDDPGPGTGTPEPPPEVVIPQLAVIDHARDVKLKSGGLGAPWATISDRAVDVVVEGDRVGVLQSDNTLWVKEGTENWVKVGTSAVDSALAGDVITMVTSGGGLLVKEGAINAPWVQAATNVASVEADGDRIGMITRTGNFHAKDGVYGEWLLELTNVTQIAVDGNRLAAVTTTGAVRVKEGLRAGRTRPGPDRCDPNLRGDQRRGGEPVRRVGQYRRGCAPLDGLTARRRNDEGPDHQVRAFVAGFHQHV